MTLKSSAVIGVILGTLYGIVLWAADIEFAGFSKLIYGDFGTIPFFIATVIGLLSLVMVLTYTWWVKVPEKIVYWMGEIISDGLYTKDCHYFLVNDKGAYCNMRGENIGSCPVKCGWRDVRDV